MLGAMRFAAFLSFLAACPGLGSRIGSQPKNPDGSYTSEGEDDLTMDQWLKINSANCIKCIHHANLHADHWVFYSSKIDKHKNRLIMQCAFKEPEANEGFTTSSPVDQLDDKYCETGAGRDISGERDFLVRGFSYIAFDAKTSDRGGDILPECEKCAEKNQLHRSVLLVFFWRVEVEDSKRKIHTTCDVEGPDSGGWERNPPPRPDSRETHFKITKDWCMEAFGEPTNGLLFWLMIFAVVVVVVAAAAGVYLGFIKKADEGESTD